MMAARHLRVAPAAPADDVLAATLDDALDRVRELSMRLWAVRAVHRPARSLLGRLRCQTCGELFPCTTLRAADAHPEASTA